eukprot:Tbor_TRINITY_DN3054_c0_g1::TRINITY_DN3054_c0_g1_i1::g.17442::m.17442/K00856/E2.7.1.20, ADK; adenosine kinase
MKKLYIQCNPLLDISARVDDALMGKYKIEKGAASLVTEDQMGLYADLEAIPGCVYIPGGSGLNTARVAQWMSDASKKSFVSYTGCIADDKYGEILKSAAEEEGVTMNVQYTTKAPTGSCGVCITGIQRALVANLGAANCITGEHFDTANVKEALAEANLFYITGYTLTIDVDYVMKVIDAAHKAGGLLMMNLSAPFIIEFFGEQLSKVMPFIDVVFGNADEAHKLSEVHNYDTADVAEIAKKVVDMPYKGLHEGRLVIFTQGPDPTIYASKKSSGSLPVKPVENIVDTNGAGDAFVGGYLAAAAKGASLEKCIDAGNYAAGVIIQHDGCTFPKKANFTF